MRIPNAPFPTKIFILLAIVYICAIYAYYI